MKGSRLALLVTLALIPPRTVIGLQKVDTEARPAQVKRLTAETCRGLELRSIGPTLSSGRIADVAVDPRNRSVWYVASASGGVWKTTNRGMTWKPIFDQYGSFSMGCITLDPRFGGRLARDR